VKGIKKEKSCVLRWEGAIATGKKENVAQLVLFYSLSNFFIAQLVLFSRCPA